MKKQSEDLLTVLRRLVPSNGPNQYILPTAIGAGIGGVGGGLLAPKGKMLRGLLRGAAVGGSTGLGLGAAKTVMDNSSGEYGMQFTPLGNVVVPAAGALTGLSGGLFANRVADELEPETNDKSRKHKKHQNVANEKQSKVYEAGEAVDGLHVKHTKMNHKKCTPGEFGAMVKAAAELSSTSIGQTQGGAPPGAYSGKVRLPINTPDQAIHAHAANLAAGNPVQPAQKGVPQTILAPANGSGAVPRSPVGRMLGAPGRVYDSAISGIGDKLSPPSSEALAGRHVTEVGSDYMQNSGNLGRRFVRDMATPGVYTPNPNQGTGFTKTQSARDFGAYVKRSFNISQYLPAAGVGAVAGAGLGALGGLINPGEEDEYDDQGRVVGRKQRSRFGAMLRNALMGAGAGGLAGGVGSALLPQYVDPQVRNFYQTVDYLGSFVRPNDVEQAPNQQQPKAPFTPLPAATTTAPMPGGKLRAHPGTKTRAQLQSDREQSLNSGEQIPEISFPNAG